MHWVERASFAKIGRLLEISERERHHEVLLTVKNLHDLSHHLSPYSVLIIPCPLPSEIVEGEHFMAADLLSLLPGGSSPAREAESEATGRELVISTQSVQPSSTSKDSGLAPQAAEQVEGGGRSVRPPLAIKDSRFTPPPPPPPPPPSAEEKEGEVPESYQSRGGGLHSMGASDILPLPGQGRRR